jgi:hypothetical protein
MTDDEMRNVLLAIIVGILISWYVFWLLEGIFP